MKHVAILDLLFLFYFLGSLVVLSADVAPSFDIIAKDVRLALIFFEFFFVFGFDSNEIIINGSILFLNFSLIDLSLRVIVCVIVFSLQSDRFFVIIDLFLIIINKFGRFEPGLVFWGHIFECLPREHVILEIIFKNVVFGLPFFVVIEFVMGHIFEQV